MGWGQFQLDQRAPWRKYKDAVDADGDVPEGVPAEDLKRNEAKPGGLVFVNTKESTPREFYINKADADKHGCSRGCGGCSSFTRGLGRQPRSDECRERFRKAMCGDAKVRNSVVRRREFKEKQNVKRKKKEDKREHKDQKRKRKDEKEGDQEMEEEEVLNPGEPASSSGTKRPIEGDVEVDIDLVGVVSLIGDWVSEVQSVMKKDEGEREAWDDVEGGELPIEEVRVARKEEVAYMEQREIWG